MDAAIEIPGTKIKIGLDPLIGLIPGIGDGAGAVVSLYILYRAFQLGVPRSVLLRMAINIGIDTLVGSVPVIGDVFDVAWKANIKNVELIEKYTVAPNTTKRFSCWFLLGFLFIAFLMASSVVAVGILLAKALISLF